MLRGFKKAGNRSFGRSDNIRKYMVLGGVFDIGKKDCGISYICIQVKENSLGGFTADDAVIY